MKQKRDSKKPIALVQFFKESSAAAPEVIQIVPTGEWEHPAYGPMKITSADVSEFKQNFDGKVRLDIPITQGHDNGMGGTEAPAIGWFTELDDRGISGLWGSVRWTDEGRALLEQGAFKYFSPEFYDIYSDPETGAIYKHVLVGGALTNKPYFKELEAVCNTFSEPGIIEPITQEPMTIVLSEVVLKKMSELSTEEKAFLKENKAELNAEQIKAFSDAVESDEERTAREEKELGDKNEAEGKNRDGSPKVATEPKDGKITMSEGEVRALQDKADKGQKAFDELVAMKNTAAAEKMVFSSTNADGKFLPKEKDALVSFVKTLSETQRDQFTNLVSKLPKNNLFKEIGGNEGAVDTTAAGELETAITAQRKDTKLTYSEALKAVGKANPELIKRYNEEQRDNAKNE